MITMMLNVGLSLSFSWRLGATVVAVRADKKNEKEYYYYFRQFFVGD